MRCDECKYWEQKVTEFINLKDDIRTCFKAKELWDCTEWVDNNENYSRQLTEEYQNQKMFVQDGSSYSATLLTRADFFCAHFEPKLIP